MNLFIHSFRRYSSQFLNRCISLSFIFGRFDFVCFVTLMMWKLIWFNTRLSHLELVMGISDLFIALGGVLIIAGWTLWLAPRWRTLSLLILNILLTALIFSDLVYFRYFEDFISISVLLQVSQVSSLGDSILSLIDISDILLFVDWIAIIPLSILYVRALFQKDKKLKIQRAPLRESRWPTWIRHLIQSSLCLIVGLSMVTVSVLWAASDGAGGVFTGNWSGVSIYNITGLFGFHSYDAYRYARDNWFSNATPSQETMNDVQKWFHAHRSKLQGPRASFSKYKGSNVIIVQVEALENFVIGKSFNGQEITPNMNNLLKESMYFSRFFHQTGDGRTSDADFGVNASLHPLWTGSVFIRYPNHTYDALPALLRASGYATKAYHAYKATFWNRHIMYDNMGYNEFRSEKAYKMDERLGWSIGDNSFLRQSVTHMAKGKKPFYSFLTTLTSHHAYGIPAHEQKLHVEPYQNTIFGDYLQSINYVDRAIGNMIEYLKQLGLWDKSILLLYGDHDNSLHEREPLAHMLGHPISDLDMLEMKKQVPLIVHLPDGANAGAYDRVSGQLDIAPTIAHWLGINTADKYWMGQNLVNADERFVVLHGGLFTNGDIFYKPSMDGVFKHSICYDYGTRKPTDVTACQPFAQEMQQRLHISDLVITLNLIKRFRIDKK